MAAKKKLLSLEDYHLALKSAVDTELEAIDINDLREQVRHRMQNDVFDIVTSALGFDRRWGKWEVDHCNGLRNAAADAMLAEAKSAAVDWLKQQAGKLPELPKAAVKALHADYKQRLERTLSDLLEERAHTEAHRIVHEMFKAESP